MIWEYILMKLNNVLSVLYQWTPNQITRTTQYQQAEDGKTELSLMHFTVSTDRYVLFWFNLSLICKVIIYLCTP